MLTKGKADYKIYGMIAFCTTLLAMEKDMMKVFSMTPSSERLEFLYFMCAFTCTYVGVQLHANMLRP